MRTAVRVAGVAARASSATAPQRAGLSAIWHAHAVGGRRWFAAPQAKRAPSTGGASSGGGGGGVVRTEAGLQELYMRAVEPKPTPL